MRKPRPPPFLFFAVQVQSKGGGTSMSVAIEETDVRSAISTLLDAEGFTRMAQDVLAETDKTRLMKYVSVVVKNAPQDKRLKIANRFRLLGLY
jgi:hypothetical protein